MPSTEKPNISYLSINLPVVIKNALEYNNKRKNPIMNTFFSRHTPTKKLNGIKVIKTYSVTQMKTQLQHFSQ